MRRKEKKRKEKELDCVILKRLVWFGRYYTRLMYCTEAKISSQ